MKPAIDPSRCKQTVFGQPGWSNQCTRKPVKDGYCNQHHPDAKKARDEAWNARYNAQRLRDAWLHERQMLRNAIADAAIAGKPLDDLIRQYEEHLKQEPPKPE